MSRGKASRRASARGRRLGRLRLATILTALSAVIVGIVLTAKVRPEHSLPLSDQSIIRHEAKEKHLNPALIAAVIYAETKFQPRVSSAGALGLMQILPSTAQYLANVSHGTKFTVSDLTDPEINIAYGSYYLSYLLKHYGGAQLPAIAAYNAGIANVDRWAASATTKGHRLRLADIPFPETRVYVARVLSAERTYSRFYASQLGLG